MNEIVLDEPGKYFWLKSGKGLRSIRELGNALPTIPSDEFEHHVTHDRNDFADWIEHVFGERELAARLRPYKRKDEFQSVLYNHLVRNDIKQSRETRHEHLQKTGETLVSDPQRFAEYHVRETERKDALADRFDAVSRRFQENAHVETPPEVEKRFEALEERYKELRQYLTQARKDGKDPFIADLILRPVIPKLSYARLTGERQDFDKVRVILDEAERELMDALAAKEPDVRAEVDALITRDAKSTAKSTSIDATSAAKSTSASTEDGEGRGA